MKQSKLRSPLGLPLAGFSFAAATLLSLSACGGGGGGGGGTTGSVAGTLAVLATETSTLEAEPNDTAAQAHRLGNLVPGEARRILGNITDDNMVDPLDAFQVVLDQRANCCRSP